MEAIWRSRHRGHNLVGSVINVHSAEWTRVDSGVAAGIDSYYEYCLKSYILTSGFTGETTLSGLSSLRALTSSTRYTVMCVWGVWGVWVFMCGEMGVGVCVWGGWGSMEFKLWQLKRIIKLRGGELQLISTASTVGRISKIL